MPDKMQLISRVIGAYRVSEENGEYVLAWGINNTSIQGVSLKPQQDKDCNFDFLVVPGPLDVLTPVAAIARLSDSTICEFIYVYGENGAVRAM